jgi:hypothetical protein
MKNGDYMVTKRSFQISLVIIACVVLSMILWNFIWGWWLVVILIPPLLLGYHFREQMSQVLRTALVGLLVTVCVVFGIHNVRLMTANVQSPLEWDFKCFWLYSHVATQGYNLYEVEHYPAVVESLDLTYDQEFEDQVIKAGFPFPPPMIFLFIPLTLFPTINAAYVAWYVFISLMFAIGIYLVWRNFLKNDGWIGLALVAALAFIAYPVVLTVLLGQTLFIMLVLVMLFWQSRERWDGGVWRIIVKQVLAGLALYALLRRKVRPLVGALITFVGLMALTALAYGAPMVIKYFTSNPVTRRPNYVYTELPNQSLLAEILRAIQFDFSASPLFQPFFVASALLLLVLTSWLIFQLEDKDDDLAFVLTLPLSLLLYPATLNHYSLLLLIPVVVLWKRREEFFGGVWGLVAYITVLYSLLGFQTGYVAFYANLLSWLVLALFSMTKIFPKPTAEKMEAAPKYQV